MNIEPAKKEDARALAYLIDLAGEGLPSFLWSMMAPGENSPIDVGAMRAMREEGGFSYKNARVIRSQSNVAGMILSYRLDDPYVVGDIENYPEVIRPLIVLESKVPGSWYVNAIATNELHRGKGIAKFLLENTEVEARSQGIVQSSLIVASENIAAKRLYIKLGYEPRASLPVVPYPGSRHAGFWELMVKDLSNA